MMNLISEAAGFIPMSERRILYFTAENHYLYRSTGNALELEAKFSADEAGVSEFRDALRGRRGTLFSVLVDLAGEDFHEDQIPVLRGGDREAVVQRRLAQRFRDARLAAALSLGYVTVGERRNERLLLASFTNPEQIEPWLDALDDSGARLAGVYSVPLLAPALLAKLGVTSGRCIVVSSNRGGLRQCFVEDGKLRFGRLERTGEMAPQALAKFVRSETQRLAQYLTTLRVLPREGTAVHVLVVAPPGQRALFEQALVSDARLVFRTVDGADAARAVGLTRSAEGTLAEGLYVHLAAKKAPREQFASHADRRRYFVWQLQRGVVAAGALAFAACAIVSGSRWFEAAEVRDSALLQTRQSQASAEQYQRITAGFPVTETSTENLKATVVEFRRIAEHNAAPERALMHVSRVLEQFPQMELDVLTWSIGTGRAAADPGERPAASGAAAKAEGETVYLELTGRVNATQRDDYRGITAQVQRFANALGGPSGYAIVSTKLPFDITPQGTLTGDIGGTRTDSGEAPRFTILLAQRLP
jgi:hypothetical protein